MHVNAVVRGLGTGDRIEERGTWSGRLYWKVWNRIADVEGSWIGCRGVVTENKCTRVWVQGQGRSYVTKNARRCGDGYRETDVAREEVVSKVSEQVRLDTSAHHPKFFRHAQSLATHLFCVDRPSPRQ